MFSKAADTQEYSAAFCRLLPQRFREADRMPKLTKRVVEAPKPEGRDWSLWDDAKWRFATAAQRDVFAADPDRYMPQFGGFWSGAMMNEVLVPANPESWTIVDGKLYMFAGKPDPNDIALWMADAASNIRKANESWPVVQTRWAAQNP